jgi:Maltose operon periplasmic protein precursor (MalM)
MKPAIYIVAGLVLLNACVHTGKTSRPVEVANPAPPAPTKALETLRYQQTILGKSVELEFDGETEKFDDGKATRTVHGVRLPQASGELVVKVATQREGSISSPSIFYPEVWILDANFQVTRVLPHSKYVFRSGGPGFLEGTFFLKGATANEYYLVVTNRDISESELKVAQSNQTRINMIAPGLAFWAIPTGTSSPPTKMIADTKGEVRITITEYKLLTIDK